MQLKSQYQELEWQTREGFSDDGYVIDDAITSLLVYCIKLRHVFDPDRQKPSMEGKNCRFTLSAHDTSIFTAKHEPIGLMIAMATPHRQRAK